MTKASDICKFLGTKLHGPDLEILSFSTASDLNENTIYFCKSSRFVPKKIPKNVFGIISVDTIEFVKGSSYTLSENPRKDFIDILNHYFKTPKNHNDLTNNHSQSNIISKTKIEKNVIIEPFCTLKKGVEIGSGSYIESGVWIGENVKIGKNCYIKSNSVIGGQGFGYEIIAKGAPKKFPHYGSVEIGNDVDIGSGCTIDRGTLSDTIICSSVKIDNQVHIGHNCFINQNTIIAASATLSGGVQVGKNCWIGPNSSILQKVIVNDYAFIGIGATIIDNVHTRDTRITFPGSSTKFIAYLRRLFKKNV